MNLDRLYLVVKQQTTLELDPNRRAESKPYLKGNLFLVSYSVIRVIQRFALFILKCIVRWTQLKAILFD